MDIINTLYKDQTTINKLYFKVDMRNLTKKDEEISNKSIDDKKIRKPAEKINSMVSFYSENVNFKLKENQQTFKYFEIEMKN